MPTDEIVYATDLPGATLSGRVRRGELRRLARGVYTTDIRTPVDRVVRRHWRDIVGRLYPNAVITDRSARTGGPVGGRLYLAHPGRSRETTLPGLIVSARTGAGPLDGDIALPGGLHLAATARALAENARASRSRAGNVRRTFDATELGAWIDGLCRTEGEHRLAALRETAERIAEQVGTKPVELTSLSLLVGAALGSRRTVVTSRALAARQAGRPYDPERVARFDTVVAALRSAAPQHRPVDANDPDRYRLVPFYEAYFSNFIEGTEFVLREAEAIVFEGLEPDNRPEDSHDLIGTYKVVSDETEMSRVIDTADEFLDALRDRHATIMGGRPYLDPGAFKTIANQAGNTQFVAPDLTRGTLVEGFGRLADLDTAWERAVFAMFLVAEVHPFNDGNGRIARVMMNGELVVGGEARIIIPTVFRDDYLGGLRRLSRQDDPSVLIKVLRFAHDYTSRIIFDTLASVEEQLSRTNAFEPPTSDRRLRLPER